MITVAKIAAVTPLAAGFGGFLAVCCGTSFFLLSDFSGLFGGEVEAGSLCTVGLAAGGGFGGSAGGGALTSIT